MKMERSNQKFKLIVGAVVVIVGLLFTANWIIGNILEQKLAQSIDESIEEKDEEVDFNYEELKVNPILAQITLQNSSLEYSELNSLMNFTWDKAVYKGDYNDLINLISGEADKIDELHSLQIDFDNLKFSGEVKGESGFDFLFSFGQLGVDFDGSLVLEDLDNDFKEILAHDQKLHFRGSDFRVDFPKLFDEILINSNLQEKLLNLAQIDLNLDYRADNKVIKIKETVDSSHSTGELAGAIKLLGTELNNITGMEIDLESNSEFEAKDLKWGLANKTGRYTVDNVSAKSDFAIDRKINFADYDKDDVILGASDYKINLEGLKAKFEGSLKDRLSSNMLVMISGLDISEVMIDQLDLNYQTDNQRIRIKDSKLYSSLFNADINADLKMNNQSLALSKINNLKVNLTDLQGNLGMLVKGMESRMDISLPREGDAIVLKVKGTFAQPQIKGVHY
ncbi:MAG: hypothetical protein R6V17_06140 [Halanaerobacter sp.]